jgi:hypothetical protein
MFVFERSTGQIYGKPGSWATAALTRNGIAASAADDYAGDFLMALADELGKG